MPLTPPSKRVASPCKYPHFSRKILNPPSRNEILDTPLSHTYCYCSIELSACVMLNKVQGSELSSYATVRVYLE